MFLKRKSSVCPECGVSGTRFINGVYLPPHLAGCTYKEVACDDFVPPVLINREMMKDFGLPCNDKPYMNWFAVVLSLASKGHSFEEMVASLQRLKAEDEDKSLTAKNYDIRIKIICWLDKYFTIDMQGRQFIVIDLGGLDLGGILG